MIPSYGWGMQALRKIWNTVITHWYSSFSTDRPVTSACPRKMVFPHWIKEHSSRSSSMDWKHALSFKVLIWMCLPYGSQPALLTTQCGQRKFKWPKSNWADERGYTCTGEYSWSVRKDSPWLLWLKGQQVSSALRCMQEPRPTMKTGMWFHASTFSGGEARWGSASGWAGRGLSTRGGTRRRLGRRNCCQWQWWHSHV